MTSIEQVKSQLEEQGVDVNKVPESELKRMAEQGIGDINKLPKIDEQGKKPSLMESLGNGLAKAGKAIVGIPGDLYKGFSSAAQSMDKIGKDKPQDLASATKSGMQKAEPDTNQILEPTKKEETVGIRDMLQKKPEGEQDLAGVVQSKPTVEEKPITAGTRQSDKKQLALASSMALSPGQKLIAESTENNTVIPASKIEKIDAPAQLKKDYEDARKPSPEFTKLEEQYYAAKEKAIQEKKDARNQVAWLQLADTIGKAMVQYAAGQYGIKHGVNMSGLEFNKNDWSQIMKDRMDAIDEQYGVLDEKYKAAQQKAKENLGMADKLAEAKFGQNVAANKAIDEEAIRKQEQEFKSAEAEKARLGQLAEQSSKFAHEKEMYGTKEERKNADKNTKLEDSYRSEWEKSPITKNSTIVHNAYQNISNTSEDAAGDMTLVYSFMKMLDPGSTVREGEYKTAANAAGIPTRILQTLKSWKDGTILSPEQREQFRNAAKIAMENQLKHQAAIDKQYSALADKRGLDKSNIINSDIFSLPSSGTEPNKPAELSEQDKQAKAWAEANPNDPRAAKILEHLKGK